MKKNNGFTLLEVAMATVILGLLAGASIMKFLHVRTEEIFQKTANNLYIELRALRPLCFRYDERVMVTFDHDNSQCKIYVDQNDDDDVQDSELHHVFTLAEPVEFGICDNPPSEWAFDDEDFEPEQGIAHEWDNDGMLRVDPDSRGEYNLGGVYLTVPSLKKTCYFIGITTAMHSIEFRKWDGSSWIKL